MSTTYQTGVFCPRPTFLHYAVADKIEGVVRVRVSGHNPDIDVTTTPVDIWPMGGLQPQALSPESWEIVSTSALDTLSGVGTKTIELELLDAQFVPVVTVVNMNGLTPVFIGSNLLRLNNAVTRSCGVAPLSNQGDIIVRVAGGGAARAVIPAGVGVLRQARYCVPKGKRFHVFDWTVGIRRNQDSGGIIFAQVNQRFSDGLIETPFEMPIRVIASNPYRHLTNSDAPLTVIPEKTDYILRVLSCDSSNTHVSAVATGLLMDTAVWDNVEAARVILKP